jgi:hypothetical protein
MVQLVFVFCLIASPTQCQEQRPTFEELSRISCMVQGQQYAQDWLNEHPKWMLARWRCEMGRRPERPI